jgi:FkbM family methyltransferase
MNPEAALLEFLYSYIPSHKALDIGAHVGDVSACLLRAGYEVYAFEPAPDVYDKLISRLGEQRNFHPFRLALGSEEGEALLHLATDLSPERYYEDPTLLSSLVAHSMPDNISYTRTVPVAIRTLAEFHRAGTVPEDIGLVKIDTEGFDLEVVRGMGAHRYPVVLTEYFDVRHPFGQSGLLYTMESLVHEMRDRGYLWHIVIHHDWHCKITGYYCNHEHAVPGTWGNVCFFSDRSIFSEAESWCSAILPRTYFKPIHSANAAGVK